MEKTRNKQLEVRYEFRSKEAQEVSEDLTEFSVVTSLCVQPADESNDWSKICSENVNSLVVTHSQFIYYPPTAIDIIYSYWQIIVAVAATIFVLVVAIFLAWKCDLFQRARIVRNQGEGEGEVEGVTNKASEPMELEMT